MEHSTLSNVDSIDESRNRGNNVNLCETKRSTMSQATRDSVCNKDGIDTSDTSRSRGQNPTVHTWLDSKRERLKLTDDNAEAKERESVEQKWNQGPTVCDQDEESRSRQARCSMSTDQQLQQPVTPGVQDESVDATVVNRHDVDKYLVTNKHTNVKQDSISVSNQWLSNAFSKITFGCLG